MLVQAEQVMEEFQLKTLELFDHAPVLRIRVPESEFARALELRATLVEKPQTDWLPFYCPRPKYAIGLEHTLKNLIFSRRCVIL